MKATLLISCEYFSMSKMDSVIEWATIDIDLPKIIKPYNFEQRLVDCEIQNRKLLDEFRNEFNIDWNTKNAIFKKMDSLIHATCGKRIAWIYFDELQLAISYVNDYNNYNNSSYYEILSSVSIDDLKKLI